MFIFLKVQFLSKDLVRMHPTRGGGCVGGVDCGAPAPCLLTMRLALSSIPAKSDIFFFCPLSLFSRFILPLNCVAAVTIDVRTLRVSEHFTRYSARH